MVIQYKQINLFQEYQATGGHPIQANKASETEEVGVTGQKVMQHLFPYQSKFRIDHMLVVNLPNGLINLYDASLLKLNKLDVLIIINLLCVQPLL